MTTAIICTAILASAVFILGLNVSIRRGQTHKAGGSQYTTDPDDKLYVAIRAHGNASEYVPTLIVLFLLVGARSPDFVAIPLIIGATLARLAHAYGMLSAGSLNVETKYRFGGAAATYIFGVALAIAAAVSLF
ncbi:Adenylosuccinate synthase [Alloactinosynnema sp. L-07]|uniref:MAPEG family protein n=1 Tax=Alloactinosynnema sp. L-07 TaxID=1653480 RepID=UPI00065EF42F|nr:MAPEG family protein [Alloactinosynnema sp. L-07]CRK57353.1 Adenylosuccinate synthase [Alloactinosynnema sp. L-07]